MLNGVVLVGGSRATKGCANLIDAHDTVVRMKHGHKLPAEDVGIKTDYLAMIHYRHWQQRKTTPRRGWMWEPTAAGPRDGDQVSVMPAEVRHAWREAMASHGIKAPSVGLCALLMTMHFLQPAVVLCAACDAFFDDIELPGHQAGAERQLIKQLSIERLC